MFSKSEYALPRPPKWLYIGLRILPSFMRTPSEQSWAASGPYYRSLILRKLVREQRTRVNRMKRQGQLENWDGYRLHPGWKNSIRDKMHVIDNAYEIEVIGVVGNEGVLAGCGVANQCYIAKGVTSGVTYKAMLLFRAEHNGNHVAYICEQPIVAHCLEQFADPLCELERIAEESISLSTRA